MILSLKISKEQQKVLLGRYPSIKFFLQKAISNKANEIIAGGDLEKELQEYHDRRVLNGNDIHKRKCTQTTKDKISKTLKEKYRGKEFTVLPETRQQMGESQRKRRTSEREKKQ